MPPPPRKPGPPIRTPAVPTKAAPQKPESFIGNDSATMMVEETFAEFEARLKSAEDDGGTNTNTTHETADANEDEADEPADDEDGEPAP